MDEGKAGSWPLPGGDFAARSRPASTFQAMTSSGPRNRRLDPGAAASASWSNRQDAEGIGETELFI